MTVKYECLAKITFQVAECRTLTEKHVLAIQHEKETATALYQIQPGTKLTLHFDTTSRSKIDGDWPLLVYFFSNSQFSLHMKIVPRSFVL